MTIAIMQPYIFPYIGYFQLIYASDVFVFYDDVNYINRGWINRNRILNNGTDQLFTIPCKDLSQNKLINDIDVTDEAKPLQKVIATIQNAYRKAPYYKDVFPLVESTIAGSQGMALSKVAIESVVKVCNYLGLQREFKVSSEAYDNRELKKADRLIDICHKENITKYVNAQGGRELYTKDYFSDNGVELSFLIAKNYSYLQFKEPFIPFLSIIDILMFNSKEDIMEHILPSYHLE
ncbi:MAG: WbqC-like family protein [Flavipsychrobacter sp.]|jgi:hypothetical protein|nr:WbqC-like family protein [Flavipsychrobacter sp.]